MSLRQVFTDRGSYIYIYIYIAMHFVIAVYPSHAYNIYALHSSQTFHQTNYRQIVYSSVDPDQMAFGIQKEINLGYTRLNCYHYY